MASIQSLGVGSGLLTSELVEDIIAAEREATDLRLDAKRAEVDAKISAFGAIRSAMESLRASSAALGDSKTLLSQTVASSNEGVVTATAGASAVTGTHTVEVLATARAHTLTSVRFDSIEDVVGEGTIDFRFGTTTFSGGNYDTFEENPERASAQVIIDSSNNTLGGIRDAINTADIGVVASIVNDGEGFVLVLKSASTGEDHSMELTVTESGAAGLAAFSFNASASSPGTHFTQTVDADDATVTIDGITVSRETNTIDEVIPGVTFEVTNNNAGFPATVTISQDTAAITEKMQAFIDNYNSLKTLVDDLTDFDEEEGVGALLTGDATVRALMSQVDRLLVRGVSDLESNALRALVDLGVARDQNNDYQLNLNSSVFTQSLASSSDDVLAMLADERRASDSQISFVGFTSETQAGSYEIDIEQAAARAQLNGATTSGLSGAINVDADNDTLAVTVDGVASGTVQLAQGSYADGAELAAEIQSQINLDANLRAASKSVEVSYDSDLEQLVLSSTSYGSKSSIGIDSVDTDTTVDFGLAVDPAIDNVGQDVAGTVNGIAGVGTGQFLTIPSGPVAATSGTYEGQVATIPATITTDNDTFRVSVDGILSNDVVLTAGTYNDGASLAQEIQDQINADATLAASGLSVAVTYDAANQRFEMSSASSGLGSSVNLTFAEAGVVADLGLNVATGIAGKPASKVADAASGIQIRVQGESVGERGTVTLVRGVMNRIDSLLAGFGSAGGSLSNRLDGLDERLDEIEEEALAFDERMDLLEERLRIQFAAADALISTLNNTSSFLDQQLSALPGFTRESN